MDFLVAVLVFVGADDGAALAVGRFSRDGDAGGLAGVHVQREVVGYGSVGVQVVELDGKYAFYPDLSGSAGFEPLAHPGGACWR